MRPFKCALLVSIMLMGGARGLGAEETQRTEAGFRAWISMFQDRMEGRGVPRDILKRAFASAQYLPEVMERRGAQAEHVRTFGDYLRGALRPERMTLGREMRQTHAKLLERVENETGVDRDVVLAIWGLESTFGTGLGRFPIISALATQAYAGGSRAGFAERQLAAALKLVETERLDPVALVGSWAGAVGHTQFMPSTYVAYAVDGDGDGRRDLMGSLPDALMSAGHYLKRARWTPGVRWGQRVRLPTDFDYSASGLGRWRPVATWIAEGVRAESGQLASLGKDAVLLVPTGYQGPAYLVSRNFRSLLRYNNAQKYAFAVGYLADALAGREATIEDWPDRSVQLTREQARALQSKLSDLGFDTGGIDGILGTLSRRAIQAFQASQGVPADGYLDGVLYKAILSAPDPQGQTVGGAADTDLVKR